jgi:hypothetical protein
MVTETDVEGDKADDGDAAYHAKTTSFSSSSFSGSSSSLARTIPTNIISAVNKQMEVPIVATYNEDKTNLQRHATPVPGDLSMQKSIRKDSSLLVIHETLSLPNDDHEHELDVDAGANGGVIQDGVVDVNKTGAVEDDGRGELEDMLLNTPYGGRKGQSIADAKDFAADDTTG